MEARVRAEHRGQKIQGVVDATLANMSVTFETLHQPLRRELPRGRAVGTAG